MLTILKCPKCGAPALVSPSLSDADIIKCPKCGFADYLKAFRDDREEKAKASTPPLGAKFLQEIAKIAQNINAISLQGNIDGYVKQMCLAYDLSPWTLIEAVNAYISAAGGMGQRSNPLRFVTLESGRARVDDLLLALRSDLQRQQQRAQAVAAPAASSQDASEWIDRYNRLQADLEKKEKSYQTLLAAYRQAQATLEENGLA